MRLFVPLPPLAVESMLLVGGQAMAPVFAENPMQRLPSDGQLMKTPQIVGNLAWAKVVLLPPIQDLAPTSAAVARGDRSGARGRSHKPAEP